MGLAYVGACFESGGIRQRVPRRTCSNESMAMSLGLRPLRIFHTCMIMYLSRRLCRDIRPRNFNRSQQLRFLQPKIWRVKDRWLDSTFRKSEMREGFQTGQEYSSLLLTNVLKSVNMMCFDLSQKTLMIQFAILLAFLTDSLTWIDHLWSELQCTPKSLTLVEGRIS